MKMGRKIGSLCLVVAMLASMLTTSVVATESDQVEVSSEDTAQALVQDVVVQEETPSDTTQETDEPLTSTDTQEDTAAPLSTGVGIATMSAAIATMSVEPVAQIGDETYTTLAAAFEAVDGEALIVLLADCDTTGTLSVGSNQVTLDLDGHTITKSEGDSNEYIMEVSGGTLTIQDTSADALGAIKATHASYGYGINLKGTGSTFNMRSGAIETTQECFNDPDAAVNTTVNISGGTMTSSGDNVLACRGSNTVVSITGGTLTSASNTFYLSGYSADTAMTFTATGGTFVQTGNNAVFYGYKNVDITVTEGVTVTSAKYIFYTQYNATATIEGGSFTSSGSSGYVIYATDDSSITVNDGTFSCTGSSGRVINGTDNGVVQINGGSYTALQDSVVQANNYSTIIIVDGTFSSTKDATIELNNYSAVDVYGGSFTSTDNYGIDANNYGAINVYGGTFTADKGVVETPASTATVNLVAGTFSSDVSGYISNISTMEAVDGAYVVAMDTAQAAAYIGDVYYATLEGALINAKAGDTIVLQLDDAITASATLPAGVTLSILEDVTLDLSNATFYVYGTMDNQGTISTATATVSDEEGIWLYCTFATALSTANAGDTITMLDDVILSGHILLTEAITIDFGTNTLTTSGRVQVFASADDEITLKNGQIASTADYAVMNFCGDVTVVDLDIVHTGANHAVYITGTNAPTVLDNCDISGTTVGVYVTSASQAVSVIDCDLSGVYGLHLSTTATSDVTIDGSTFVGSNYGIIAYNSSTMEIVNATIQGIAKQGISASYGLTLDIGANTTITGADSGIAIIGQKTGSPVVTIYDGAEIYGYYGVLIAGAYGNGVAPEDVPDDTISKLYINGGTIGNEESNNAVIGNGAQDYTYIEINGGTLTGGQNMAISHPQTGDMVITGGTIQGPTGMQYGGNGTLTITGDAHIIGTDEAVDLYKSSEDGDGALLYCGSALALASRGAGYQDSGRTIVVSISGDATLESYHNEAISVLRMGKDGYTWVFNDEDVEEYPNYLESLTITGGTFIGEDNFAIEPLAESEGVVSITGGVYSVAPEQVWVGAGYYVSTDTNDDGYWYITNETISEAESLLENLDETTDIIDLAAEIVALDSESLAENDAVVESLNELETLFEAAVAEEDGTGNLNTAYAEPTSEVSEPAIDTDTGVEVSGLALSVYGGNTDALADDTTTTVFINVTEKDVDASALLDDVEIDDETAIVLEIKPMEQVDDDPATEISNDALQTPVTFKIYLSDNFEGNRATVYHITESGAVKTYNCTVYTNDTGKYIQLTVTEFSSFVVSPYTYTSSGGTSYYTSSVASTSNGSVSISASKSTMNATITITATPDDGYAVGDVSVTYASGKSVSVTDNGDGTYAYKQPGASVTVTVAFVEPDGTEEEEDAFFVDVATDDYFYQAVLWAVENGITAGTTDTTFSPDTVCNRAQAVTFLYRAAGEPSVAGNTAFTDLDEDGYYYDAVLWAVSEGITAGTTDETFSPYNSCTRGQIVTFLYRAAGAPDVEGDALDVDADAYCYNAVIWAVENGITTGYTDGTFGANDYCTRAQIVTFLYRFLAD